MKLSYIDGVVISPQSEEFHVRNLRLWCEDNQERFKPDPWRLAYAGLLAVNAWLCGQRSRKVGQWKGRARDIP